VLLLIVVTFDLILLSAKWLVAYSTAVK